LTTETTESIETEGGSALIIEKRMTGDEVELSIRREDVRKCLLHWGIMPDHYSSWQLPPKSIWPAGSAQFDSIAIQSPFVTIDGESKVDIKIATSLKFPIITFVLFFPEEGRWDNNQGKNYRIEMPGYERPAPPTVETTSRTTVAELAEEIIKKEMSRNSWTLMHRFNLCYDLLDKASKSMDGLALIFVWLRFSAVRQLDWQRNYNTKPRELAHAMDRLTLKLAGFFAEGSQSRQMIRLIMTTLGRGGEGQRVRDEILHIMHRHNIKEISGHFLEEWHQKLHNNTTPDDVVLCEAYIGFLKGNGDLNRFYRILGSGGVTKDRLESYERPIRSHPDFIPHLKDALIHDFEHFLGILRSVHSGTDLGTAIFAARRLFDPEMGSLVDFIWSHREDRTVPLTVFANKIGDARHLLSKKLGTQPQDTRDLIYLDLALEDFLRLSVEKAIGPETDGDTLAELIAVVLENINLSLSDAEFGICLRHWKRLSDLSPFGREGALHARAVLDRLHRGMGTFIDRCHTLLQPKADFLGEAFHADSWTVKLFTEEVLRGRPAFVLSALIKHMDPLLRRSAELGDWQVISPGHAAGQVEVISKLRSIQGKVFNVPAVIVTEEVSGDEEIPQGVKAIITPVSIDILAHISVRARNANVLFATCYDTKTVNRIKELTGKSVQMSVSAAGEVVFGENRKEVTAALHKTAARRSVRRPDFTAYAVSITDFDDKIVGGKSNNLRKLYGLLPPWIRLPASAALPFGVFERVLGQEINRPVAARYNELVSQIANTSEEERTAVLAELRMAILRLRPPDELVSSVLRVMDEAGLGQLVNWDDAWTSIKRVWASKWNERAYLSRATLGIAHEDLFMAVLVQLVVEADYSYVIHTVNPFTGKKDEIYAEAVLGLGETLVGNYPGRALSFKCIKGRDNPALLSFPSKSVGLFGGGLIFRSDSNGEDLAGYAGAGLYDSFMVEPARKVTLDYISEPLVWDMHFRATFMSSVAKIGAEVEKVMGSPQDIEGAHSGDGYFVVQSRPQVGVEND
jgi:alpha-glucan,water dikinase